MQSIKLGDKEYPIKFTYSALMELEKRTKKTFSQIANDLGTGNMTLLMEIAFVGFQTGGRIEQDKFKLTLQQLGDLVTPDILAEITELFGEAFAPKEVKEDEAELKEDPVESKN